MWQVFNRSFKNGDHFEQSQRELVDFLNELEEMGWEPRKINFWSRNSYADKYGVTIYARAKAGGFGVRKAG